ncbi:predicted protein [Lichtheimia corymbifera JMRC:FSU:9682]|uniref:Uncharacterized protein n=1 Tax=Lichtheimia corymbifera JMRC:FSU:9682 TaxID=1263082 RepID=A0A068S994_9FUNG|nr:predicted protein [Lichtheimia corymbifera JMRC:FSU:9682]
MTDYPTIDLNWCTYCDNAISPLSESLYCSEKCLRADALRKHPSRGYTWHEFDDFLRRPKECQIVLFRPLDLLATATR